MQNRPHALSVLLILATIASGITIRLAPMGPAITAARDAGARRILYTSHMGARRLSAFAPADQHAGTEEELARSGVAFTALRHGFYAESCLIMVGDGLKSGELRVPDDGPIAWTARDDLAEAHAVLLAEQGRLDGPTPPLTAREALTMAELAAIASEVTGRTIQHATVSDEEWRETRVAMTMPTLYADMLLGTFRAARQGDFAVIHPTLEALLGRPPRTMRDVLAAADIWKSARIRLSMRAGWASRPYGRAARARLRWLDRERERTASAVRSPAAIVGGPRPADSGNAVVNIAASGSSRWLPFCGGEGAI